ncbi:ATP-dependent helicase dcl2-2 [Penicillium robsamsonii]|uniref:ATP-dependent helicase dcl2-2 n=1 Tax=Penicillium robsamsonii TaxID=1792511 RepID=UPI002548B1D8|nr:ATP-dependent helicase dcl2-2 [Penicillium robsamsonii]KAJ5817756.1 ATP-dependent helicase dcl2-2 [Penicillium robsamsonii]
MALVNMEKRPIQERAYQLEMFRSSLQQNIIVAMGTGTGKTLVFVFPYGLTFFDGTDTCPRAVLRIQEALNMNPDKLVWFLCPTIALCEQQVEVLRSHLPFSRPRSFTGRDQVDHWGEKSVWDAALNGVRVGVSTHQVLLDALTHGFLIMNRLSLLVFDEAHHCTNNSPANRIMKIFYHPYKKAMPACLPRILGLSASPVHTDILSIQKLESDLDSRCMAPHRHYKELLDFTNRPKVSIYRFLENDRLNRTAEPHILSQLRELTNHAGKYHHPSMTSQLRRFVQTSEALNNELGSWAAAEYIFNSIKKFKEHKRSHAEIDWSLSTVQDFTMQTLCELGPLEQPQPPTASHGFSPKCRGLLEILSRAVDRDIQGLIFVSRRATAIALISLIEHHTTIRDHFRCGTFVGMSNMRGMTGLGEWRDDTRCQDETLKMFRMGALNLIITTSALEEGIDIPACDTVISFNRPLSLRSFVQRRGRARKPQSTFIVFADDEQEEEQLGVMIDREDELARVCQDVTRALPKSPPEERCNLSMKVKSTGAELSMSDAVIHLDIFCAKLLRQPYVTNQPLYNYRESPDGQVQATVLLPSALYPSLQETDGLHWWASKKHAKADAALQAYKALRGAGLVNDHLLPTKPADLIDPAFSTCKRVHLLPEQIHPWSEAAAQWNSGGRNLYAHRLQIERPGINTLELMMIIPLQIQRRISFPLFSDGETIVMVHLWPGSLVAADDETIILYHRVTRLILQSIHGHLLQPQHQMDFIMSFVPDATPAAMQQFLETYSGSIRLDEALENANRTGLPGLIRSTTRYFHPYIMNSWPLESHDSLDYLQTYIHALPRRRNFLSRFPLEGSRPLRPVTDHEARNTLPELQGLTMDRLPLSWANLSLYIPSITYELGVYLVTEQLREQVLSDMTFRRIGLLSRAIRPTCSERPGQFRRLAFVGATFLKYITSEQIFLHHPTWHQGLLSKLKDTVISDRGLAQAAKMCGLGKFLITKQFNGKKWKPELISSLLSLPRSGESRKVSARTLAEMVRAIVGAAYMDGGNKQAAGCAIAIVPAIKTWHAAVLSDGSYKQTRPSPVISYSSPMHEMEQLIGYTFTDRSLLVEAVTHPSHYASGLPRTSAYGRLSFLGNAVLEQVVTETLIHSSNRNLRVERLQSLRAAVTNHLFLTFLCLEFNMEVDHRARDVTRPNHSRTVETPDEFYLWTYLRSHSLELTTALGKFRSASRRDCWKIQRAFLKKSQYPWAELSAMEGHAVLGDIVQSVLGAVFVDSGASLPDCQRLTDRMGILPRVKQFLHDDIVTDHPRILVQKLYPGTKISYQGYTMPASDNPFCCAIWVDDKKSVDLQGFTNTGAAMISAFLAVNRLLQERP